jgi:hypothetical protein
LNSIRMKPNASILSANVLSVLHEHLEAEVRRKRERDERRSEAKRRRKERSKRTEKRRKKTDTELRKEKKHFLNLLSFFCSLAELL